MSISKACDARKYNAEVDAAGGEGLATSTPPTVEEQLDDLVWLQHAVDAAKYQGGSPS